MRLQIAPCTQEGVPQGVKRVSYVSEADGLGDWALAWPPAHGRLWVVGLHGHGSRGDQLFVRSDIRDAWLAGYRGLGLGVLSPNLRGNAWMSPNAASDLRALLDGVRQNFGAEVFYFSSGSMGATGNLIYAAIHPEDVAAVAALSGATDLASYHDWCLRNPGGVRDEVRRAIAQAYGGSPEKVPAAYAAHSALGHAQRLSMPVLLAHGAKDDLIPVEQSRLLAAALRGKKDFTYVEIPDGNHDGAILRAGMVEWLSERIRDGARL